MKPIPIDFAPRGIGREIASMRAPSWALAILGLALCIGAGIGLSDQAQQQGAQENALAQSQARNAARAARVSAASAARIPAEQAVGVNRAIQQLNLPWSALLDAIERATPADVALLELEPDARRHLVKGVAEARTPAVMVAYIGRLKKQGFFSKVVLTRHEASAQDASKTVRFEFEAEWSAVGS